MGIFSVRQKRKSDVLRAEKVSLANYVIMYWFSLSAAYYFSERVTNNCVLVLSLSTNQFVANLLQNKHVTVLTYIFSTIFQSKAVYHLILTRP